MYQLEIVKDDDETNEAVEKHQMQYSELHRQQMILEEQTEKETKNYLEILEKVDKSKKEIEQAVDVRLKKMLAQKQQANPSGETVVKKQQFRVDEALISQTQSGSDDEDDVEIKQEIKPEHAHEVAEPDC